MKRYDGVDDGLDGQRAAVAQLLAASVATFAAARTHELGQDLSEAIARSACAGNLLAAANLLRMAVAELLKSDHFDSEPYWDLVDGIGFWNDALPGRWPYSSLERREQSLQWALEATRGVISYTVH